MMFFYYFVSSKNNDVSPRTTKRTCMHLFHLQGKMQKAIAKQTNADQIVSFYIVDLKPCLFVSFGYQLV